MPDTLTVAAPFVDVTKADLLTDAQHVLAAAMFKAADDVKAARAVLADQQVIASKEIAKRDELKAIVDDAVLKLEAAIAQVIGTPVV